MKIVLYFKICDIDYDLTFDDQQFPKYSYI